MSDRWICLIYHDVSEGPTRSSGGPEHFTVPQPAFADQLDAIREAGLIGSSVEALLAAGPAGRVGITFDDGDLGQYGRAFPTLVSRGMSATFYVTTSWVGRPGYASWSHLREMRAAGMSIQSHTHSHPFLSELDAGPLREEFHASKQELDARLDQNTTAIALPGGDFPRRALRGLLAETGYRVVSTSRWGWNPAAPRVENGVQYIRRCTVRGEPDLATYRRVVSGDASLAWRRQLREAALASLRSTLGPTRYAGLRRRFFDVRST